MAPTLISNISTTHRHWRWLRVTLFMLQLLPGSAAPHFCVDYSARPKLEQLRKFNLSILSPDAQVDLHSLLRGAHRPFAYLSVVEVAKDAKYRGEVAARKIPLLGRNEIWGGDFADVSNPAWADFVVNVLAARAVKLGYRGFFLDTADSVEFLEKAHPQRGAAFREGLLNLIRQLKQTYPDRAIILNRGFPLLAGLVGVIDGVLVESLYRKYDFKAKQYVAEAAAGTEWLLNTLNRARAAGLEIYVIDYVAATDRELARETARRIAAHGFHPFISTVELDGKFLQLPEANAPPPPGAREVPRTILCLYGNDSPQRESRIFWPADAGTTRSLQMPLEWMGYRLDYLHVFQDRLPATLPESVVGIILDRYLDLPDNRENEHADWLIRQKEAGRKILFCGGFRFAHGEVRDRLIQALGFSGTGKLHEGMRNVVAVQTSPLMNYEAVQSPTPADFHDFSAPAGSQVLYAVEGVHPDTGERLRFEPIFTCSWGGFMLDPYTFFMRPDEEELWIVDPFRFLAAWLGHQPFPVPDTTTRDGVRIFFAHVDGDGFGHKSAIQGGRRSGEFLFEQIVRRYPFPITCSIIEAEVRALITGQDPKDEALLVRQAREMLAPEHVEAGSHAYTHPYFWIPNDRTIEIYDRQNLALKPGSTGQEVNYQREVIGSINYINQNLLPPGKQVEIMLWSGNCRPGPEALRHCLEAGVENMNGGDTARTRKHPSLMRVAGNSVPWGEFRQVFAAHQNENVYRFRWKGGAAPDTLFWSGFMLALDSFRGTETPRRLKPVNIYYHWYSGDNIPSFNALKQLYEWAVTQELHSLTAARYARIVRDAVQTRIHQAGPRHWSLRNAGHCRTFRLDGAGLIPDVAASSGVTGWRRQGDALYVHTDGSPDVELLLAERPAPHLYLESSTAEIRFQELAPRQTAFYTKDYRNAQVMLAGLPPRQPVVITVNGRPTPWAADEQGRVKMDLPPEATVRVTAR